MAEQSEAYKAAEAVFGKEDRNVLEAVEQMLEGLEYLEENPDAQDVELIHSGLKALSRELSYEPTEFYLFMGLPKVWVNALNALLSEAPIDLPLCIREIPEHIFQTVNSVTGKKRSMSLPAMHQ